MIIEILIDKNLSFKPTSKYVDVDYYQIDGKENYILKLTAKQESIKNAIILLCEYNEIKTKVEAEGIKIKTLKCEPSLLFQRKLYPLIQKFEINLRKLLNIALCDTQEILNKGFEALTKDIKSKLQLHRKEYEEDLVFEYSDLSNIFMLLFRDEEAYKSIKGLKNDGFIHKNLKDVPNNSIWETCFKPKYKDFKFDTYYVELYTYRNHVMHFHNISYDDYKKANKLFNKANKELDRAISSHQVLDVKSTLNSEIIASNYLKALTKMISSINYNYNTEIMATAIKSLYNLSSNFNKYMSSVLSNLPDTKFYNTIYKNLLYFKNEEDSKTEDENNEKTEDIIKPEKDESNHNQDKPEC
ncbi:MAG: hypothetical protein IKB42_05315 [Clostridia bacterium]|nr:hypothetical protein [Clostridia bacterium]